MTESGATIPGILNLTSLGSVRKVPKRQIGILQLNVPIHGYDFTKKTVALNYKSSAETLEAYQNYTPATKQDIDCTNATISGDPVVPYGSTQTATDSTPQLIPTVTNPFMDGDTPGKSQTQDGNFLDNDTSLK